MRTTLELADDLLKTLDQLARSRATSFEEIVDRALRQGVAHLESGLAERFVTGTASLGSCLVGSLDDVSEALARAEGESFR
jgi:predicted transcriptional regulator